MICSDGEKITGLSFVSSLPPHQAHTASPIFEEADEWLDIYFSGKSPGFLPSLKICGTEFQKSVYGIMLTIPFGQVMTYSEIAAVIAGRRGSPGMSAQAVGGASSRNRIALMIPCHRVIGKNGSLTGYAGGLERKRRLLELEGIDTSKLLA